MSHQYLDIYKEHNRNRIAKCYRCNKTSKHIDAIGAKIVYTCGSHKIHNDALRLESPAKSY